MKKDKRIPKISEEEREYTKLSEARKSTEDSNEEEEKEENR
jgi:hypothetical protein